LENLFHEAATCRSGKAHLNNLTRRVAAAVLALGALAFIIWAPGRVADVFHNLLALSNIALFVFAAGVLLWFLYAVILRRLLRARRIANARMKRMLRESAGRIDPQNDD
jgi:hypothetical protein